MSEPVITYNELMTELEKFRKPQTKYESLTKEQMSFIKKCVDDPAPVPVRKMHELWLRAGWPPMARCTLSDIIEKAKKNNFEI